MTQWTKTWTAQDVMTSRDPARAFAEYAQQTAGIPWPTQKDFVVLRGRAKAFFEANPGTTWFTLCRVVDWCRTRKRRIPRIYMVIEQFRNAWASGALPDLDVRDRVDPDVERGIAYALENELRPEWRRRLLGARGLEARREAIEAWRKANRPEGWVPSEFSRVDVPLEFKQRALMK